MHISNVAAAAFLLGSGFWVPAAAEITNNEVKIGILTLPASIAIKDPIIAELFCKSERSENELEQIARAVRAAVPAAEERLDQLAVEAKWEAHLHCANPAPLYALVEHTRELSRR